MIWVVHPGSRIPDPDADFLPIPDPGSRGQKGTQPGSRIWIRNTDFWPGDGTEKIGANWQRVPVSSQKYGSGILDPEKDIPDPDLGVKKLRIPDPDPQHCFLEYRVLHVFIFYAYVVGYRVAEPRAAKCAGGKTATWH